MHDNPDLNPSSPQELRKPVKLGHNEPSKPAEPPISMSDELIKKHEWFTRHTDSDNLEKLLIQVMKDGYPNDNKASSDFEHLSALPANAPLIPLSRFPEISQTFRNIISSFERNNYIDHFLSESRLAYDMARTDDPEIHRLLVERILTHFEPDTKYDKPYGKQREVDIKSSMINNILSASDTYTTPERNPYAKNDIIQILAGISEDGEYIRILEERGTEFGELKKLQALRVGIIGRFARSDDPDFKRIAGEFYAKEGTSIEAKLNLLHNLAYLDLSKDRTYYLALIQDAFADIEEGEDKAAITAPLINIVKNQKTDPSSLVNMSIEAIVRRAQKLTDDRDSEKINEEIALARRSLRLYDIIQHIEPGGINQSGLNFLLSLVGEKPEYLSRVAVQEIVGQSRSFKLSPRVTASIALKVLRETLSPNPGDYQEITSGIRRDLILDLEPFIVSRGATVFEGLNSEELDEINAGLMAFEEYRREQNQDSSFGSAIDRLRECYANSVKDK